MGLKVIDRNGVWQIVGTVAGKRIRQSAKTGDKKAAQLAARELERAIWEGLADPRKLTFEEAALEYMQAGGDTRFLAPLIQHFQGWTLDSIKPGHVQDAARAIYPTATPATWNRQGITPAQAVINFASERGECAPIRVRRYEVQRKKRPAGNREWLDAFRAEAGPEVGALALFMFVTGARIKESASLRWEHIDHDKRRAWLAKTKTEPRECFLTPELADVLDALPRVNERVFRWSLSYLHRHWRAAVAAAGIAPLTPQEAGRRGFGTEMVVRRKVDPKTASELGGWASPRMLMEVYATAEAGAELIDQIFDADTSKTQPRKNHEKSA